MRKKITLLMSFLLIAFFTFGQEWQTVEKAKTEKEKDTKKEKRGINPYRNSVDGIEVNRKAPTGKDTYNVDITDSPGPSTYETNTLEELGWETFNVAEFGTVVDIQIDYTWSTDSYPDEGSFHIESPNGTSAIIASGEGNGTYSVVLTEFEGEAMNGDWDIWIEDSFGDGGHQATGITVTFTFDPPPANDAGVSEIVSLSEDDITYDGEKDISVKLKNYGTDELTSTSLNWGYILNEDTTIMSPESWTGSLAQGETEEVTLGSIDLEAGNTYQIGAWSTMPNGVEDENHPNDTSGIELDVYKKGQLIESFEDAEFPPYNWLVVNNDGGDKTWIRDDSYSYDGMHSASVGYELPNDDWLITPKLIVEEGDELSFWALSTSSYFLEDFNVLVSKESNDIEDFSITLDEVVEHPNEWIQHSYNLADHEEISAGDEIYVAVQCVSDDQLPLAVDMFTGPMLADIEDNDVAVNEVVTTMIRPGEDNELEAVVKNAGLNDQTSVEVTFEIEGQEVGATTLDNLTYQESDTAAITWTAPEEPGVYTLDVSVSEDDNNANNTATKDIWSLSEQTSFVMDYENGQLLNMILPYSQDTEVISSTSTTIYAGSWALGKWYAVSDANELLTVDTADGTMDIIGTLDLNSVTGLAYDWSSNTMYAMDYNDADGVSELYTVDLETAEVSQVGLGNTPGININLACDLNGNLYSMNMTDDKLYSISSSAGAGTAIGDLGIDINYAQDMEFDHTNGDVLYTTAYTSEGGLYVISTETGEASLLGGFAGGNEYGGFAIPYTSPVPNVTERYPENNSEDNAIDTDIYVVFDQNVDSVDFSGISVTGENSGEVSNVSAELTDSMITISHDPLANDDVYTVNIPAGAVSAEEPNEEISWSFGTIMAAPEATVYSPEMDALGVPLDADVSVKFDQEISDNDLASVTMTGNVQGAVTNVNASINPDEQTVVISHDDFTEYEDTITVTIPANAVVNEDGVMNADPVEWQFYTMKEGQPVADSLAPANNETGVALDADVLLRLSPDVTAIDLSGVTIEGETEGQVSNVDATLTDSTIHIAHDPFANNNERYTVTVPADAVESTTEPNEEIKWNFTTIKSAPQLAEMSPADGATKVALDQDIMFSFDQEINTDYSLDTMITIIGENEDTVKNLNATMHPDGMGFTINHDGMGYNNAQYTVTVPADLVYNSDEVMNQEEVSWTFTTIMIAPTAEQMIPEHGATDVSLDADVSLTLDQDITENDLGVVSIESAAMGEVSGISATIQDDNRTIAIDHDDFFTVNDDIYTVRIPASSVMNSDGVYNQEITWSFQTVYTYDITFLVQQEGTPVENVTVTMFDQEVTTDASGKAVVESVVEGGPYDYSVMKDGYKTVNGTLNVTGLATVAVNMEQGYTVTFDVSDQSGFIEEATVKFNGNTKNTDADGLASFADVDPGDRSYIITKSGYDDKTGTVSIESGDVTKNVVMTESEGTGINDLTEHGIEVYPNPTNGVFYVTNEDRNDLKLVVKDLTGKLIINKNLTDSYNEIDLSGYSSGVYLIQMTRNENTYNGKILLK